MPSPIEAWEAETTAAPESYSPGTEELRRVTFIQNQVEGGERARKGFLRQAYESLALFTNRQWARYDETRGTLTEPLPGNDWELPIELNYVAPAVNVAVAKLTQHQPGWVVAPESIDDNDIKTAKASDQLLDHNWHKLKIGGRLREAVQWAAVTGAGLLRGWWDPAAGDDYEYETIETDETGAPVLDEMGQPRKVTKVGKTGYSAVDVCSPLSVVIDPGAVSRDLSDARWAAQIAWEHIDELRIRYPKSARYIKADSIHTGDAFTTRAVGEVAGNGLDAGGNFDRARVLYYFERPSARHPRGYYAVTCNGMLLEEREELHRGRLPFVLIRMETVPGRLYGLGMIERVKEAQRVINWLAAKRNEIIGLHSNPKWAVEKGSLEGRTNFTNEPDEIVEYNPGFNPPRIIDPPPLPTSFAEVLAEMIQHIREITGVNEISQGVIPAAISGRAAQWMAELDSTKLGPTSKEIEEAMADLGMALLELWRDYMPVPQTLKVLGEGKRVEVIEFHASEIRSTDVRVLEGSMLPRHPSVLRETRLMMADKGWYGDPTSPEDRARFFKDMQMGGSENERSNEGEVLYAREENYCFGAWAEAVAAGQPYEGDIPRVVPTEDHNAHLAEHRVEMGSVPFRQAPAEVFEAMIDHIAQHEAYASMKAQGIPWWQARVAGKVEGMPPPQPPPAPAPEPAPAYPDPNAAPMDPYGATFGPEPTPEAIGMTPPAPPIPMSAGMQVPALSPRGPGVGQYDTMPEGM